MCEQKPYPVWFSRLRNSAQCEPADTSQVNHNSAEWRCAFNISFYIDIFQRKTLDDAYPRLFLTGVPLKGCLYPPQTATAEFENQISVYAAAGV